MNIFRFNFIIALYIVMCNSNCIYNIYIFICIKYIYMNKKMNEYTYLYIALCLAIEFYIMFSRMVNLF